METARTGWRSRAGTLFETENRGGRRAGGALRGAACWRADRSPIGVGGGYARPGVRFRAGVDARP